VFVSGKYCSLFIGLLWFGTIAISGGISIAFIFAARVRRGAVVRRQETGVSGRKLTTKNAEAREKGDGDFLAKAQRAQSTDNREAG
jgi:hypothetical protein